MAGRLQPRRAAFSRAPPPLLLSIDPQANPPLTLEQRIIKPIAGEFLFSAAEPISWRDVNGFLPRYE